MSEAEFPAGNPQIGHRYLVLTPFAQAEVVAAILKIRKISAEVFTSESGVLVGKDLPVRKTQDWDIAELFPDFSSAVEEDLPLDANNPEYVAGVLSELSPYGVVLIRADLGEDIGNETGVAGVITAQRVINGKLGAEIAPGLLLGSLDPTIEELLISSIPLASAENRIPLESAEEVLENIARSFSNINAQDIGSSDVNRTEKEQLKPEQRNRKESTEES